MMTDDNAMISVLNLCGIPLPKQQRSFDTYHRILRSAQECVAEMGYSKTSTQEVARRAEISHGGLFKRFPTKVSLMACMVGYLEAQARREAAIRIPSHLHNSSTQDRVRFFIESYWRFVQTPQFKAIDEVWDESRTDEQLLDALRPIIKSDVIAGDLAFYFPELENGMAIQFISQMVYSSLEYLSFNHGVGADDQALPKMDLLVGMVCREIDSLRESATPR
ncbi:TetR/AcrR family transcriptional regulator [Pseudomonas sp. SGAir0191]|uniref:TetR/AcrR family transcriptional regulator n=1 Tax=Pseudomonas putida group TaxID=136845 RepID=UPI000C2C99CE|nr:TetR/AcrR family transcriptional regulator [Pseudomonas sp. SGAir0191]AUA33342.1 TetR/AcrR family transcriptional regulator [Pseudomonas sp. SGAir0191]